VPRYVSHMDQRGDVKKLGISRLVAATRARHPVVMPDLPRQRLRVLRFREGTRLTDLVREDAAREQVAARRDLGVSAWLYLTDPDRPPVAPQWLPLVRSAAANPDDVPDYRHRLTGAALVVERRGRLWALTFGLGRNLLNEDWAEPRFGMMCVLNLVDAQQLHSVNTRVHEDIVVRTERQVSRRAGREAFTIDDTRDILREVTGVPQDTSLWGRQISGSTAVSFTIPFDIATLADVLDRLDAARSSKIYKKHFAFVDFVEPVVDASVVAELDAALLDAVAGRAPSNVYLAPPEPVQFDDVAGFLHFREPRSSAHPELELADYRRAVGNPDGLTVDDLKRHSIRLMISSTGEERRRWSVYRCLVHEVTREGELYMLSEGEWFAVERDFVRRVDREVSRIGTIDLGLPPARLGEQEAAYNLRAAQTCDFALTDTKTIMAGGTAIEVADLVTDTGNLIHVKRKTQSATLSHLFAQGRISASTLKGDAAVRTAVRELLVAEGRREAAVFDEPFSASARTVVYAVIAKNAADLPGRLPFFSRLNLWHTERFLSSALEYDVRFIGIEFET
jgi:uncharacterized protein (TIGR04141 family)